jgi:hypothetical protein
MGGCRIGIVETVNGLERPVTDERTDSCVEIKRVSRGCQFQTKMLFPMADSAAET